jgi:hypothetical protein|tara:strand:- start:2055 stop:2891 length:837 start_codon:yes stop_codon:yes gene_type:complete
MHKKLESDLMSLAHSILQMKNKENVFLLKQKSYEIYEKLSVLAFVEEYVNSTPGLKETKEDLMSKVEKGYEVKDLISEELEAVEQAETVVSNFTEDFLKVEDEKLSAEIGEGFSEEDIELEDKVASIHEYIEVEKEVEIEQPFDDIEGLIFGDTEPTDAKEEIKEAEESRALTLEEELEDTIPVDVMANLFEPVKGASLNDKLKTNIQIGLNDRIAFVKNLFEGSQEDFNRVISQLNTLKTEKEAKKFINKIVKPDYNWSEHEDLENRLIAIIIRRFS